MNLRGALSFLEHVLVEFLHPAIAAALVKLTGIMGALGHPTVVTSGADGEHQPLSYHYDGRAVDVRTHMLSEDQKDHVLATLKDKLSADYHVLLEDRNAANEHLHIEYRDGQPPVTEDARNPA